jgi:hypothetical protein
LVAIFHVVVALTHNECTGDCLLVGKTYKGSIWRVEFIMVNSLYYYCWRVVSEVHKLGWLQPHRVCGFLNMQLPIKVKLK